MIVISRYIHSLATTQMQSHIHTLGSVLNTCTTQKLSEETKNHILNCALQSKTNEVIKYLDKYKGNLNDITDICGRNLLHIAAGTNNSNLVKHLIMLDKFDKNKRDIYGDTPYYVAMKNHNVKIYDMLTGVDNIDYYVMENSKLSDSIKNLNELNYELTQSNTIFSQQTNHLMTQNKNLREELALERKTNKRLRQENDVTLTENKRLKTDNSYLQKTIQGYSNSMKKK